MFGQRDREPSDAQYAKDPSSPRPALSMMSLANEDDDVVDLRLYLRALHKRRWTVATVFFLVVLATLVYSFTATPIYEATAQLLIEPDRPNVVSFKEVIDEAQQTADYYQTQLTILRSRALAKRTIDAADAWAARPLGGASEGEEATRSASQHLQDVVTWVGEGLSSLFSGGDQAAPRQEKLPDETVAQARAIDALLGSLHVGSVRNTRLINVAFRSADPAFAARMANALVRAYIEQDLEFKFLSSKDASDWLGARLAEQRQKVEESEVALQGYREQHDAISLEDRQNIVVQKLVDLNAAVTKAKTERISKESEYNQLRAMQGDRAALDTVPAILANAFIQGLKANLADLQRQHAQLSERLGQKHPDLLKVQSAIDTAEARLRAEVDKVVQSLKNEYRAAVEQERALVNALEAQKGDALGLNRRGIEYGVLQRDAESNRQIYESLLQRTKETGISGELRTSNIRVVDEAEVPRAPVGPNKRRNLLLGLLGGCLLGIGVALFFEFLDNRIKTPDEVRAYLGLPSLGLVPLVPEEALHGSAPLINNGVPAGFSEALRTVRTNLLFSSTEGGMRTLAVTSTSPGEGKTLIASNLAIGLAQTGGRVLLIDADLRRSRVHHLFGVDQEPGLSNLLVGSAKPSQVLRRTLVDHLWILTAGRMPPNPAELLGSQRFADFVSRLRDHFDWIVLDTPPVMAVTDASVVAHLMTGIVFVVGAEMVTRQAAQAAIEQLRSVRGPIVGAVLNRIDFDGQRYYYAPYYKKEYAAYYTPAADEPSSSS